MKHPEDRLKRPEALVKHQEDRMKRPEASVKYQEASVKHPEANLKRTEAVLKHPEASVKRPEAFMKCFKTPFWQYFDAFLPNSVQSAFGSENNKQFILYLFCAFCVTLTAAISFVCSTVFVK